MAALASTTTTEKKARCSTPANKMNMPYTRTFTWTAGNGETAGTATTSIVIPANTAVIGGWHKSDQDWGGTTTIAYSVSGGQIFAAATILNQTAGVWKALTITQSTLVNVPAQATDGAIVVTTAQAATPAVAKTTVTVTLLLCPVGVDDGTYTTFTA